jgi:hypothetical protein
MNESYPYYFFNSEQNSNRYTYWMLLWVFGLPLFKTDHEKIALNQKCLNMTKKYETLVTTTQIEIKQLIMWTNDESFVHSVFRVLERRNESYLILLLLENSERSEFEAVHVLNVIVCVRFPTSTEDRIPATRGFGVALGTEMGLPW